MRGSLRAAAYAAIVVLLVGLLLASLASDRPLLPLRVYYVPSRSMEPTLAVGDLVIAIPADPSEVKCGPQGDVIIYRRPDGSRVIHRAVACVEVGGKLYFLTKGDNNPFYDQNPLDPSTWIPEDAVVAKMVLRIPLVGLVPMYLEPLKPLVLIAALVALAYVVYSSLSPSRARRS
ncbi:MAG: signal peptidase I [Candidatus Nezhaarchaeales archaeon]